jgi:hypothetical protein
MDRSIRRARRFPLWVCALGFAAGSGMSIAPVQAQELCGGVDYPFPYTDVSGVGAAFCPGIMEAYVTGVSKGTTPTTFSPNDTVTRVQMTTFLQRSLDQSLVRSSRRAALNQWWTPQNTGAIQTISVGGYPRYCVADGQSIWLTNSGQVIRLQASTGKILASWTGATTSLAILVAAGKVFVGSQLNILYVIDPTLPPGTITVAADNLGTSPNAITFDGTHLWTANGAGSVSIITPQATLPYPVTTVTGFTYLSGIAYDGANIWVTAYFAGTLLKLDANANVLQTITVGSFPLSVTFDGENLWVPAVGGSITVVQASTGSVVATISPDATNRLSRPQMAAFDGERILITNSDNSTVTLFKAADLSFIANVSTGSDPIGACSDGNSFWITLFLTGNLLRF